MNGNGGNNLHETEGRARLPNVLVGMEKSLERELGRAPVDQSVPEVKRNSYATRAPLQTIADAIKRLVWDDNEKFAQMINEHYQTSGEPTASMASALQRAADDLLKEDNGSRQ